MIPWGAFSCLAARPVQQPAAPTHASLRYSFTHPLSHMHPSFNHPDLHMHPSFKHQISHMHPSFKHPLSHMHASFTHPDSHINLSVDILILISKSLCGTRIRHGFAPERAPLGTLFVTVFHQGEPPLALRSSRFCTREGPAWHYGPQTYLGPTCTRKDAAEAADLLVSLTLLFKYTNLFCPNLNIHLCAIHPDLQIHSYPESHVWGLGFWARVLVSLV